MKRFVIRSLAFALIVVAALACGEAIVRTVDNPYRTKAEWMDSHAGTVNTLFLGNSHTFYGLRADLWPDRTFNLSNVSQTVGVDVMLLKKYIDKATQLRCVVSEVSYGSLFDPEIDRGSAADRAVNYQTYMHLDILPPYSLKRYEFSSPGQFTAKLGNALGIGRPKLQCDSLGNGLGYTLEARFRTLEKTSLMFSEAHNRLVSESNLDLNIRHLSEMADLCEARDIRLVLYTQPAWKDYRTAIRHDYYTIMCAKLDSLSRARGIEWYNFFDNAAFTQDDFFDADHLTRTPGAEKMTQLLVSVMRDDKALRQSRHK